MTNRLFAGLTKSHLEYLPLAGKLQDPATVSLPPKATLLIQDSINGKDTLLLKPGDAVKTGQKLMLAEKSEVYTISSFTGTITALEPFTGDFGWTGTAISIDVAGEDAVDDSFEASMSDLSLETVSGFLAGVPGNPDLSVFSNPETPIDTIVISGMDSDLQVATQQQVLQTRIDAVIKGIDVLKKTTGIDTVVLVVPINILSGYGHIGAEVRAVSTQYPSGLPRMVAMEALGRVIPAGKSLAEMGIAFFNVEAAACLGDAFEQGRIPVTKLITLIDKKGNRAMVSARIGTPIDQLFRAAGITVNEMDRIINGGPMTGTALYLENHPVETVTDAVMVQDKGDLPYISDYPCINCGECVRACPVRVPVNMLVRFLEAGHYEEAVQEYDLDSCVDCGLCSYVCVSRIPIYQYIKLAKHELAKTRPVEETNA
ncbi:4Fe-4S dicluster domain-containing protein [Thermodesulfobacteriota bacterium]